MEDNCQNLIFIEECQEDDMDLKALCNHLVKQGKTILIT